jgi:hypothetical protein
MKMKGKGLTALAMAIMLGVSAVQPVWAADWQKGNTLIAHAFGEVDNNSLFHALAEHEVNRGRQVLRQQFAVFITQRNFTADVQFNFIDEKHINIGQSRNNDAAEAFGSL